MSRGLGKVERRILEALQTSRYGSTSLSKLAWLVAGGIEDLEEDTPIPQRPRCGHRASIRYEGGEYISDIGHHYWPCPTPNGMCWNYCQDPVGWINQERVEVPPAHTEHCFPKHLAVRVSMPWRAR